MYVSKRRAVTVELVKRRVLVSSTASDQTVFCYCRVVASVSVIRLQRHVIMRVKVRVYVTV